MNKSVFTRGRLIAGAFVLAAGSGVVGGASVVHMVEASVAPARAHVASQAPSDDLAATASARLSDGAYLIEKMHAWKIYRSVRSQCNQGSPETRQGCLDMARKQRQLRIAEAKLRLQPHADKLAQVSEAR